MENSQIPQFPQLTFEQAKEALDEAIASFEIPENKALIENALAQLPPGDPIQRMIVLVPIVEKIQQATMAKYGFAGPGAVMNATMQINMHAMRDPDMQTKCQLLLNRASGRI